MREDGDFTAYAEARWPALVRCLVLVGSPVAEAASTAERALVRCRLDWRAIREAEDIDVEVYAELLAERDRVLAQPRPGPGTHLGSGPDPSGPYPSDAARLLTALLEALDRLEHATRCAVVLRYGAGLSPVQVARALDVDVAEVDARVAAGLAQLDPEELVQRCR